MAKVIEPTKGSRASQSHPSHATKVVEVSHLKKSYGKVEALLDISFSVDAGSCFGLLGPNGAGKSTTMKVLTGIVDADGGSASILGLDVAKSSIEIRRQVGYVPQNITLYEKLTAWDNLVFFGKLYGVRGRELESRIEAVLEQIGLSSKARDKVESFSGGMKRRINMAAAMLHRPKLLILDEPTVGIDPQSRNHIFTLIRSLRDEGVTIIYSTHYMEEVEALCNQVAIIDRGTVIKQGSLQELLGSGKSVYVEADGFETLLPKLGIADRASRREGGWVIAADSPQGAMMAMNTVLQACRDAGAEVQALELMRPSLESVFLSLTGTSLRD